MAELTRYVDEAGETVVTVYNLTPPEPVDCCMCGRSTFDHFAVPYYCGPVRSGKSEGGYAPACQRCYDRWARWDDAMEEYDSWLAVLRACGVLLPRQEVSVQNHQGVDASGFGEGNRG